MSAVDLQDAVSHLCDNLSPAEQRAHPRHPFHKHQKIAPIDDDGRVNTANVRMVQCLDISAGGFSYIVEDAPRYQFLIVALGSQPNVTCMKSEVVQVCHMDYEGKIMVRVGCQFITRLSNN